jgi:alkylation response protein AidB-like acyl-CoA dehydrogenase
MDAAYDIENKPLRKIVRRLQQEVKDNGMWAAHLPPHLGGQGHGAVKLAYMNEMFGIGSFGPRRVPPVPAARPLHGVAIRRAPGARGAGAQGRLMISTVKASMAKIAAEVTTRAVHPYGSIGLSNVMRFSELMAAAIHEGAADGVTEVHLANVSKLLLRSYSPAEGSFPRPTAPRRPCTAA